MIMLLCAAEAPAQELSWRPANVAATPNPAAAAPVTLCRPQPLTSADLEVPPRTSAVVRAQAPPDMPPPPPPFAPGASAGPPPGFAGPTPYNCGQVNSNADLGFWSGLGQKLRHCWTDTTGGFAGGQGRSALQSDHTLDIFASPVTNPFYFEDPRALTQIKPLFIWQHTPAQNPYFASGNNYFAGFQASVAITPWISVILNEIGWVWLDPKNGAPVGLKPANGFSQVEIGPQFTFIRNCTTGTAAAFGLIFEIPIGSSQVLADTGTLSLRPYFSFAQNFGKSQYGSFNFMTTVGYDLAVDNQRNDFFFASFHLDYDVGCRHVWYPLIELNFINYPYNGKARDLGFGGGDLYNFGSYGVAGHDELTVALGVRIKPIEAVQFGLAAQANVLSQPLGRHLDAFRLTADVIFRY
jgi:hypothetical protein